MVFGKGKQLLPALRYQHGFGMHTAERTGFVWRSYIHTEGAKCHLLCAARVTELGAGR